MRSRGSGARRRPRRTGTVVARRCRPGARAWIRVSHRTKDKAASKRRWEVVYEDPSQGFKRRTKGGFVSKTEAERWRDRESPAAKEAAGKAWVDPARGDATVTQVAEAWLLSYTSRSGKARGRSQHEQIVRGKRSLLRTEFGETRVGDITPAMVSRWINRMADEFGRSPSTIRHNFYTLRLVMRHALAEGLLLRDPTAGITTPQPRSMVEEQQDRHVLTVHEVERLIGALPQPWDMYVRLTAATGMRPEELGGLRLRDVEADCSSVSIRRVLVKDKSKLVVERQAKTRRSRRTVDLDDHTAELLADYISRHKRRAAKWFTAHDEHEHPGQDLALFVGVGEFQRGQRQRKSGTDLEWLDFSRPVAHGWFMDRHWPAARQAAGLPDAVRFYDLRHFHISWLVARLGEPGALTITEISERVGHASTAMTLDRYSHSQRGRTKTKRSALGAMWTRDEGNVTRLPTQAR